eukprot:724206-Hanusia_phi.AAC.1
MYFSRRLCQGDGKVFSSQLHVKLGASSSKLKEILNERSGNEEEAEETGGGGGGSAGWREERGDRGDDRRATERQ